MAIDTAACVRKLRLFWLGVSIRYHQRCARLLLKRKLIGMRSILTNKEAKMSKLSKAVIGLILSMAGAGAITTQFLDEKEGNKLTSYQDGVLIWTVCKGVTRIDGKPVTKGMKFTAEQCDKLNREGEAAAIKWVKDNVKVKLSDPQIAAVASFCYWNIGVTKCKSSTFWRKLNAGDTPGACKED